jgi:hypothetical protein
MAQAPQRLRRRVFTFLPVAADLLVISLIVFATPSPGLVLATLLF